MADGPQPKRSSAPAVAKIPPARIAYRFNRDTVGFGSPVTIRDLRVGQPACHCGAKGPANIASPRAQILQIPICVFRQLSRAAWE